MRDRPWFVVGILVIVAVVAWLVLRDDDAQSTPNPPPPVGSGDLTRSGKISAPEQPALPGSATEAPRLPDLPPPQGPTAEDRFDEEARDAPWATKTEAELAQRWKKIRGGKVESSECRQSQCRVTIVGNETDVGATVADLEGPRGLHGYAQNVLLTRPEQTADGTITLKIFVLFDR